MLNPIEISIICVFVGITSVVEALSARFYLRDISWPVIFRHPQHFGGTKYLISRLGLLCLWMFSSIVLGLVIAALIKAAVVKMGVNFTAESDSGFTYMLRAMPSVAAVVLFIGACVAIKSYTKKQLSVLPEHLTKRDLAQDNTEYPRHIDDSTRARFREILVLVVSFVPHFFYRLYRYFYLEAGKLINGYSNVLLSNYDPEIVVRFFEQQGAPKPLSAGNALLNQLDGNYENSLDWAQYLLTANIRLRGFHNTKADIEAYVESRKSASISKRESERIRCKNPIPVMIRCKGLVGYAKLLEYSEGYRGFYITTNLDIDKQESINLTIDDTEYTTKVVHQKCFIMKERIFSGYGLSLAS